MIKDEKGFLIAESVLIQAQKWMSVTILMTDVC